MSELAKRAVQNPLLQPEQLKACRKDLKTICVLNPGAFEYQGRIGLLLRCCDTVATPETDKVSAIIMQNQKLEIKWFELNDPKLNYTDPRAFSYDGEIFLTTFSTLLPAWSDDGGKSFSPDYEHRIFPKLPHASYGLEDARVTRINEEYIIICTAVSANGAAPAMLKTSDWKHFSQTELILPPLNKDCALFPEKIEDHFYMLHRPTDPYCGNHIYLAESPDLSFWGKHHCLLKTRPNMWDSARIGAGAAPVKTPDGWLEIYHGADESGRYALGAFLLDLKNPRKVLARTRTPIMEPSAQYECKGFYSNCIFSNGQIVKDDTIILFYGAADQLTCRADFSIREILDFLKSNC